MRVVAVVGRNASGKDELADYLYRRCGIPVLSSGDVVREMAREQGIEPTRDNLHRLSRRAMVRQGDDFLMQRLMDEIESHDWPAVVISGVRTPDDVEALQTRFGDDLLVVYVEVDDPKERYQRMLARDAPRDPESYEAFLEQEREEEEIFSLSQAIRRADITIENNSTLEAFYQRIEKTLVRPLLADEVNGGESV